MHAPSPSARCCRTPPADSRFPSRLAANGVEAAIILIAAMLAFPAPWKHRLVGILAGLAAVQALNVVRVISLFYIGQWNLRAFEWAHLYAWQALIMLDVLIVWLVWIRALPLRPDASQSAVP
jgi:exosortase H (IPTLxxWG-CTERM-specific)